MGLVTGVVYDATGKLDSRDWEVWSPNYAESASGGVVSKKSKLIRVTAGVFRQDLDPGVVVLKNPDGNAWTVTVPVEDIDLWDLIALSAGLPEPTPVEIIEGVISEWLEDNPPSTVTDLSVSRTSTAVTVESSTGVDAVIPAADASNAGVLTSVLRTKLVGIETAADVTDAANVAASGAVMYSDTSVGSAGFVIDQDDMSGDSATKVPTQSSVRTFVLTKIAELIGAAPAELDTWIELVGAIQDNQDALEGINTALAGKQPLDATLTALAAVTTAANRLIYADGSDSFATTDLTVFGRSLVALSDLAGLKVLLALTKSDVGLGNVTNTSDANKPVSTAQQNALDLKLDILSAPEVIRDTMGVALVAGTNVTITPNDGADTITIAASGGGGAGSGYGLFASMGSASTAGSGYVYHCSDIDSVYRSDGANWVLVSAGGGPTIGDPTVLSWTQRNVGTATIGSDKGSRLIVAPSTGGTSENLCYEDVSGFGSGKTVTAKFEWNIQQDVNVSGFLCISDGTKVIGWGIQESRIIAMKLNTVTSYNSAYDSLAANALGAGYWAAAQWWRIRDDGTNLHWEVSRNGMDWFEMFAQRARTDFLTATRAGWAVNTNGSTRTSTGRLRQFAIV